MRGSRVGNAPTKARVKMQSRYKSSWSQAPASEPSVLAVIIFAHVHEAAVGAPPVSCRGVPLRWVRAGRSGAGVLVRQRPPAGREAEARADGPGPTWKQGRKTPRGGEGQREARTLGDTGGARKERESAPVRYSTLHPQSPAVRAATPVRPPSRPAPLARCAVRALGRVSARVPPLPPCLCGGTGAGGPRVGRGKVVEAVDRQRVDGRGRHGCVDGKRVGYSSGEASGGRMSSGRGGGVVGGT